MEPKQGKNKDREKEKKIVEIEDDYRVRSKIANSEGMSGIIEGYPVINRSVFDISHEEPDESEYSEEDSYDYGMLKDAAREAADGSNDEYAVNRRRKYHRMGYDG